MQNELLTCKSLLLAYNIWKITTTKARTDVDLHFVASFVYTVDKVRARHDMSTSVISVMPQKWLSCAKIIKLLRMVQRSVT